MSDIYIYINNINVTSYIILIDEEDYHPSFALKITSQIEEPCFVDSCLAYKDLTNKNDNSIEHSKHLLI